MANIQISKFDVLISKAHEEFFKKTVEADIRGAHGELLSRPLLSGIPEYVYEALVHNLDQDQKYYDAEVDAQRLEDLGTQI